MTACAAAPAGISGSAGRPSAVISGVSEERLPSVEISPMTLTPSAEMFSSRLGADLGRLLQRPPGVSDLRFIRGRVLPGRLQLARRRRTA